MFLFVLFPGNPFVLRELAKSPFNFFLFVQAKSSIKVITAINQFRCTFMLGKWRGYSGRDN